MGSRSVVDLPATSAVLPFKAAAASLLLRSTVVTMTLFSCFYSPEIKKPRPSVRDETGKSRVTTPVPAHQCGHSVRRNHASAALTCSDSVSTYLSRGPPCEGASETFSEQLQSDFSPTTAPALTGPGSLGCGRGRYSSPSTPIAGKNSTRSHI